MKNKKDHAPSEDLGMTMFLVVLGGVLFVLFPLVETGHLGRSLIGLGLSAVLVAGIFAVAQGRGLRTVAVALAVLALGTEWLCSLFEIHELAIARLLTALVFLAFTTVGMLIQVVRPGRITGHRIRGALAVYLMLGLVWGMTFTLVDVLVPGSFDLPENMAEAGLHPSERRLPSMVYFSFVTLSTVGYGEIVPLSPAARNLALLEALIGPLYLAVLVARLVSLEIAHSMRDEQAGSPEP